MLCPGSESWRQALIECDLMARKLHPSLMPLVAHKAISDGAEGGTVYLLMPLYQNGSLWDYVSHCHNRNKGVPAGDILAVTQQVRKTHLQVSGTLYVGACDRSIFAMQ
jgi:serine/threonine protein kinase